MNVKQLFTADGTPVRSAMCGVCGRVWESVESAERCCRCSVCGQLCSWHAGVTHPDCDQKRRAQLDAQALEKAELIEFDGPFVLADGMFLWTKDDVIEHYETNDLPVPEFVHTTTYHAPMIDIESIFHDLSESMHEDWEEIETEGLSEAIGAWNGANANNGTYWEDREHKTRLRSAEEGK